MINVSGCCQKPINNLVLLKELVILLMILGGKEHYIYRLLEVSSNTALKSGDQQIIL